MTVLRGRDRAVAMHPPHRNAAASSHGDSRSRLSRNQSIQIGTADNSVEIDSARRNTAAASPLIPANMPRWTSAAMTRTAARTASTTPHTRDFRNGGAVSKRSPEVGIDN